VEKQVANPFSGVVDGILCGDALEVLRTIPDESVHCCVTSPPYWGLRDYGVDGQLGLEATPEEYVARLVEVFREVRRVLRDDGTLWLNLGDSYATGAGKVGDCPSGGKQGARWRGEGSKHDYGIGPVSQPNRMPIRGLKPKDLVGIPWRVAFALQADGWYLRSDIIWAKTCCMPESVRDRPTKAHEYIFLLSKNKRYYYNCEAIKEPAQDWGARDRKPGSAFVDGTTGRSPQSGGNDCDFAFSGRNKRSVWTVTPKPFPDAHFAVYPPDLIRPCILAGCPPGGTVLDPFFGAGTTGLVAKQEGRHYIGIELNPDYVTMAEERIQSECPMERLAVTR